MFPSIFGRGAKKKVAVWRDQHAEIEMTFKYCDMIALYMDTAEFLLFGSMNHLAGGG